jgi:hypothetical protein
MEAKNDGYDSNYGDGDRNDNGNRVNDCNGDAIPTSMIKKPEIDLLCEQNITHHDAFAEKTICNHWRKLSKQ